VSEAAIPAFAAGVKFRFDSAREAWILLAPERLFLPDETAVAILQLVDGTRGMGAIIDELATRFDAPRDVIAVDVAATLRDLADKGVLRL
jgi:pyrroloquinoline quinone biosynthesis protein D